MSTHQAVSYILVSGKGQADGDGPDRQRLAIARFAKASAFNVVQEFSDLGISGTKELADRPGLAALLDRLESNGVRTVIIERADRLARDLMVQEVIVGQFSKIGARILTADGVDLTSSDDPTRRLIRQVLGAVAEFEKNVVVLKLRAARERKRSRGERVEGVKPYAYFPAEQSVLARMKQLRRKPPKGTRLSIARIAEQLNSEGHRNRAGREWSTQLVHHVLRNAVNPTEVAVTASLPKLPPMKSKRALSLAAMLKSVLALLNRIRIRATYGAIADVLGTNAQNVGKLLGDRRPEASWVVAQENGRPSGYTREEEHPALYDTNKVITTGDELRDLLSAS